MHKQLSTSRVVPQHLPFKGRLSWLPMTFLDTVSYQASKINFFASQDPKRVSEKSPTNPI